MKTFRFAVVTQLYKRISRRENVLRPLADDVAASARCFLYDFTEQKCLDGEKFITHLAFSKERSVDYFEKSPEATN